MAIQRALKEKKNFERYKGNVKQGKNGNFSSAKRLEPQNNSGLEITKKNHCDGDIFEHSFRLQNLKLCHISSSQWCFIVISNPVVSAVDATILKIDIWTHIKMLSSFFKYVTLPEFWMGVVYPCLTPQMWPTCDTINDVITAVSIVHISD